MATVPLPPIGHAGSTGAGGPHSLSSRSKHSSAHQLLPMSRKTTLRSKRDDKTYLKMDALRKQLPLLTKTETDRVTYSFKNNLCLDMLREGYHEAFSQIFNIMKMQHQVREEAGPESTLWMKQLLADEPIKLTTMKNWLIRAERASLDDDFITVYQCHHELAKYFQTTSKDDKWISDHFFDLALKVTDKLEDGDRLIAEANCNTGLALKEAGEYNRAREHFEIFYSYSVEHESDWLTDSGTSLVNEARRQLSSIYLALADVHYKRQQLQHQKQRVPPPQQKWVEPDDEDGAELGDEAEEREEEEEDEDARQFHDFLIKSYDKACEARDIYLEGLSSYKLGVAYNDSCKYDIAIKYLNVYKDACLVTGDTSGLGTAYEALAKALQSIGKEDDSIRHLELYAQVSENSKNDNSLSQACSNLGQVFNILGEYDQAVDNFNKSYNISRAINDESAICISRVFYGIATAHKMNSSYLSHLTEVEVLQDDASKHTMATLMDWKDSRAEEIIKSDTESSKYEQEVITSSDMMELTNDTEGDITWSDDD